MKKLSIVFVCLLLAGCASVYQPPAAPVCAAPEAAGSVICAIAARLNTTPEQLDAMFLDASLVGIGTKIIKAADLRAAVTKAKTWVVNKQILTVAGLTQYLVAEAAVDPALAMLISRRLGIINLPDLGVKLLTAYDVGLVVAGLDHQLEQLAWF